MHDLSKYQQNANKEQRGAWAAQMDSVQSGPTAPAPELTAARCFQHLCVYNVLIYLQNDDNLRYQFSHACEDESPSRIMTIIFR